MRMRTPPVAETEGALARLESVGRPIPMSLVLTWAAPQARSWLLIALGSHAVMRIWSAFDFIPKALAFERAEPGTIDERAARSWTRRSLLRLPLDCVTCVAMLAALVEVVRQ